MSIADLSSIFRLFSSEPTEEDKAQLFKEAILMTLGRATSADSNIKNIEVDTVRQVVQKFIGEEVSEKDVRMAANSKLFESAPLERYLTGVGRKLDVTQRIIISNALIEVIRSDERISTSEVDYFNKVANALALTPADLSGLLVEEG
jgi:uncharacterized tellurite resistance protein B-like protein